VALKADYVDIFTDVKGIMTADPRIVEDASHLDTVTYTEISNMAHQGAKVVHPRAVEVAMHGQVPIRVRSTMSDDFGTLVTGKNSEQFEQLKDRLITGIAHVPQLSQVKVTANEADYDFQMNVFKAMSQHHISVDFINVNPLGVVYTVPDDVVDQAIDILKNIGYDPAVQRHCAKVSVIGAGIAGVPGVMSKIVEALTGEDIQILQSADSHTTIWVLVKEEHMEKAVRALHRTFQLHEL
jgi:aspartate kinase